jgi:hypothetical protein
MVSNNYYENKLLIPDVISPLGGMCKSVTVQRKMVRCITKEW